VSQRVQRAREALNQEAVVRTLEKRQTGNCNRSATTGTKPHHVVEAYRIRSYQYYDMLLSMFSLYLYQILCTFLPRSASCLCNHNSPASTFPFEVDREPF
jgi:hypothetical protein